ncbi:MAG: hypothetical protein HYR91_03385 [Flavobacteriia bacterium]|nr:hypothetical protein [Flavobacteriia bacterium]
MVTTYFFDEGVNRLNRLYDNPPSFEWSLDVVISPRSLEDYKNWDHSGVTHKEVSVALDKVVGTYHCDYYGKTWIAYSSKRAKCSANHLLNNYNILCN